MSEKLDILTAFAAKRWTLFRARSVGDIKVRQAQLLAELMAYARKKIPFYHCASATDFLTWPIIDKDLLMQEFGAMNSHGLSADQAWKLADASLNTTNSSASWGDLTLGTSTGTSGQRGLFLVSSSERTLWLGSILARCLPDFPFKKHRVALLLATGNDLYKTASASGRLQFSFFDLKQGLKCHSKALQDFKPDVLIGPPKAVRAFADAKLQLKLKHVFTGGEVLDPLDAKPIAAWFGVEPRSIYQATEGFLGVACASGHIHLNEDDMIFEEEQVPGYPDHFVPIITDLRRRAQAMIRYRLNDVLVKLPTPCPCGSPLKALVRVEGRCDDVLEFGDVKIMPDALRAVILDADRSLADFRLVQKTATHIELTVPAGTSFDVAQKTKLALANYLKAIDATQHIEIIVSFGIEIQHAQKLRRIKNEMLAR